MSEDTSEKKEFTASRRKLRKMREKGQIARSKDVTTIFALSFGIIYLLIALVTIYDRLAQLFEEAFQFLAQNGTDLKIFAILELIYSLLWITVPVFVLVIVGAYLSSALVGGGSIPISFEPLVPKFSKINPVEGAKRLFAKKALFDFGLNVLKMTIVVCILVGVQLSFWPSLVNFPTQGFGVISLSGDFVFMMLFAILMVMLIMAAIDYIVQRALFMENAKMTKTERKREAKDQEGSPEFRQHRQSVAKENVERPVGLGLATFTVESGPVFLAFRFVEGETPVPVLVGKATTAEGVRQITENLPKRLARIRSPFAKTIKGTQLGHSVTKSQIGELAGLMSNHGLY